MAELDSARKFGVGGLLNDVEGPLLASANTMSPTHRQHRVSGTAVIKTINLPYAGFAGSIVFYPTGIWTWDATGNIAVAGTTTAATSPVTFTYFPSIGKWVASRLS